MKVAGNGQGKILTPEELRRLFTEGFVRERERALFGICLFTGCRVSEALALQTRLCTKRYRIIIPSASEHYPTSVL